MITLVAYNENLADFPQQSVEMRPACSPCIRRRLRKGFGASVVTYAGQGFNNAHHRLRGISGSPDLIVRRMLAPVEALSRRLEREYRVLEYLAEAGYPHAPRPFRRLAKEEIDDCPGFAMQLVDGTPIDLDLPTCYNLGSALSQLHRIPPPDWLKQVGSTTDPVEILSAMSRNHQAYLQAMESDAPKKWIERVRRLIFRITDQLPGLYWKDRLKTSLLHGDPGAQNCFRARDSLVLVDWEFAAVSHPLLDLMWVFYTPGFGPAQRGAFFQGYGTSALESWLLLLPYLHAICIIDLAIWAQSGLNDIAAGRNTHFLRSKDRIQFDAQVARLTEAEVILMPKGAS